MYTYVVEGTGTGTYERPYINQNFVIKNNIVVERSCSTLLSTYVRTHIIVKMCS